MRRGDLAGRQLPPVGSKGREGGTMTKNKFVRYTCNKKNEPVFRKDCMKCPEYNPCGINGKWCFVGALVAEHDPACASLRETNVENMVSPMSRDMSTITVHLGDGMEVDVLRENIRKQMEESFYRQSGLFFGRTKAR